MSSTSFSPTWGLPGSCSGVNLPLLWTFHPTDFLSSLLAEPSQELRKETVSSSFYIWVSLRQCTSQALFPMLTFFLLQETFNLQTEGVQRDLSISPELPTLFSHLTPLFHWEREKESKGIWKRYLKSSLPPLFFLLQFLKVTINPWQQRPLDSFSVWGSVVEFPKDSINPINVWATLHIVFPTPIQKKNHLTQKQTNKAA